MEAITIEEIANGYKAGYVRLGIRPDVIRNAVDVSFVWHPRHEDGIYVADFSGIKFRKTDPFSVLRTEDRRDCVMVSADHLQIAADQLLYAAGMTGYCEMSKTERESYQAHIKDLQEQNAKLLSMVAGVIENE